MAVLINNKWIKITSNTYINERIVTPRSKIDRGHLNIIGVYVPENGRKDDTAQFYDDLQQTLDIWKRTEHVLICGDLNSSVGNLPIPGEIGNFGENRTFSNFKVTYTFFWKEKEKKKEMHKYTWRARSQRLLKMKDLVQDVSIRR